MKIKRFAVATFSAALMAGLATWSLEPGQAQDNEFTAVVSRDGIDMIFGPPDSGTLPYMVAQARIEPASFDQKSPFDQSTQDQPGTEQDGTAVAPAASPLDGLSIVKQSIRRAGLGSRAMATLVLRNTNDYPVKDVAVRCAFKSRDGVISTERVRTIDRTIKPKSREALPPTLIGFITVLASDGKCSLVSANRV